MKPAAGGNVTRTTLAACVLIAAALLCSAAAEDYPSRPVTIIVPFPPGASNDTLARFEADALGRALHQSFIVENRPGAGGDIGISYAAKATPDGYTLLHAPSAIILLPYFIKSLAYKLADFDPVTLVGLTEFALVVTPSLNVGSVAELISRARANPGALTYASAGISTPHQIFAELFKTMAGVEIRHIPYKGGLPGLTDVVSGNVSMMFTDLTPALPLIRDGKLKILAVTSGARLADLPEVPSIAETLPGYDANSWQGFFARAGTPKAIVTRINAALVAELKEPQTAARLKAIGVEARWDTPDEFRAFIAAESARWGKLIRAAGIEPQ